MEHRFLSIHYQLHSMSDNERTLEEQTTREHPFQFISGFGISLEALEKHVIDLEKDTEFDFTLAPAEAFGDYDPEGVHKLEREVFCIDGKFDTQHVYPGAIITLTDTEGKHFMARVTETDKDGVTVDTNHPLAGKTLNFTGEVIENRPATDEEINALIRHMAGGCGGCGGHCGDGGCGNGGCGDGGCGEGGCGEGGCGEGCGHCHE